MTKTQRALKVPCPRCTSVEGQACTLVHMNPNDPLRSERHEMTRCHKERYIESTSVSDEA